MLRVASGGFVKTVGRCGLGGALAASSSMKAEQVRTMGCHESAPGGSYRPRRAGGRRPDLRQACTVGAVSGGYRPTARVRCRITTLNCMHRGVGSREAGMEAGAFALALTGIVVVVGSFARERVPPPHCPRDGGMAGRGCRLSRHAWAKRLADRAGGMRALL